ncbi:hypothetical protein [Ferrimonas marina]|uniref:Uncharacterized protein n=1 Tax=Ferrimonas marina TaxID=299255 RepID=A0A1M5ZA18_9GAMM|nr:hypothetical protein [Ferrimonas marina]SHI20743.1 hypothetical protein SAMN02745129_0031 [Ferrimonas marina]
MKPSLLMTALLALSPLAQADVPHVFEAGQAAKAAEVNTNFSHLASQHGVLSTQVVGVDEQVQSLDAFVAELQQQVTLLADTLFPQGDLLCHPSHEIGNIDAFGGVPFQLSAFTLSGAAGEQATLQLWIPLEPVASRGQRHDLMVSDVAGYSKDIDFCGYPTRLDNTFRIDYDWSDSEQVVATFYTETELTVRRDGDYRPIVSNAVRFELGEVSLPRDGGGDYRLKPSQMPSQDEIEAALLAGYQVYYHSAITE